jgi:L-amino acid N-acyltransferase YncA
VSSGAVIRPLGDHDLEAVAAIYAHYVEHTSITFDLEAPSAGEWGRRLAGRQDLPWLACEADGEVVGFAYGGRFRPKEAYRPTVETTIYLRDGHARRGLGRRLCTELLAQLTAGGFHSAVAGITLPNDPSVALHEALGYERVGLFSEVGHKFGRWHDVGFWMTRL